METWTIKKMYPSGAYVDMLKPEEAYMDIVDIAWSLSMQCRFGGCISRHYSVAEHSIFVAALCPQELRYEGLMHDAHEAYIQDLNTGFKKALGAPYKELDDRWRQALCKRFNLSPVMPPEVHHADMVALATERRDLGLLDRREWPSIIGIKAADLPTGQVSQATAFNTFLDLVTKYSVQHAT